MRKLTVVLLLALAGLPVVVAETFGVKKRSPKPHEFGNVVMGNYSDAEKIAPVVFRHWFHRSKYTCRLCHVDLGFAMVAGETDVRADDNRNGLYCGSCHNGKVAFRAEREDPPDRTGKNCVRCHSQGEKVDFKYEFYDFVKDFPKARFGNRVDWMIAEEQGLIQLEDYLEGVSIRRAALETQPPLEIESEIPEMPDIIFSHDKHIVWNGCELCHPQIFGVRRERNAFHMQDNFEGKFCGACHGTVAFTTSDCQLCHEKQVQ